MRTKGDTMRAKGYRWWLVAAVTVAAAVPATPALARAHTSVDGPGQGPAVAVSQPDRLGPSIAAGQNGSWLIAFHANTDVLWTRSSSGVAGPVPGNPTLAPGTSPSVVALPTGGYRIAYRASNGMLHTATPTGGVTSLGLGMAPESSPSIAISPSGAWLIAFVANTGVLWTRSSSGAGGPVPGNPTVALATSPSVVALPTGGFRIAYQASSGELHTATPTGGVTGLGLNVAWRSSPSIAVAPTGRLMIAFVGTTGYLWTWSVSAITPHPALVMGGTSPSMVWTQNEFLVAFEGAAGTLWWMYGQGQLVNSGLRMSYGSSPAAAFRPGGGWITAVEANTGMLHSVSSSGVIEDLRLGMPL